jgi:hypothetical protein
MKRLTLFLISALIAGAQTVALSLSQPSGLPGSTPTLSITFTDASPSANISAFEWTLSLPAGFTAGAPTQGPVSTAGQKVLTCSGLVCVDVGSDGGTVALNNTAYGSGVVATVPLTISTSAATGSASISAALVAVNAGGSVVTVPTPAPVTFAVLSIYDLTGDGVVNASDVAAAIQELLAGQCTSPFSLVGDGKCNLADVVMVLRVALGLTP